MENTQAAPICMCVDAPGQGICFSKKALPGKVQGLYWVLSMSIQDVLSYCDLAFLYS